VIALGNRIRTLLGRPLLLSVAAIALTMLVLVLALPPALMQNDEGVKLIQAQSLWQTGWRSRALPYPGATLDSTGAYFPLRPPFAWWHSGHWYGLYPTPFVALSALAWRLGGLRAIFLLPWAAAVAAVALTGLCAERATGKPAAGAFAAFSVAVATPLALYGTLHFEHTIGVALLLGALVLIADPAPSWQKLILAGVLIGLGPMFRTELYCAPFAVVPFALVLWGPRPRTLGRLLVVGGVALLLVSVHWLWNQLAFDTWEPVVSVNRMYNRRLLRTKSLSMFFPDSVPMLFGRAPWQALALAALAGLCPTTRAPVRWLKLLLGTMAALWVGYLSWRALHLSGTGVGRTVLGCFATAPVLVLGLVRGPWPSGATGRLGAACVAGGATFAAAIYWFDLEAKAGGLQLGARYMLPAVPLLCVGAVELLWSRPRLLAPAVALLGALSVAATLINLKAEAKIRRENADVIAAVRSTDGPVITNFFWVPHVLAPIYFERPIFRTSFSSEMLVVDLFKHGVRKVVRVHGGLVEHRGDQVIVKQDEVVLGPQQVIVYSLASGEEP